MEAKNTGNVEKSQLEAAMYIALGKLAPDFKKLTIRVDRKGCDCNVCSDRRDVSPVLNFSPQTAKTILEMLGKEGYAPLIPGIKIMVYHEMGHSLTSKIGKTVELTRKSKYWTEAFDNYLVHLEHDIGRKNLDGARFFTYFGGSEQAAQMYAMTKVSDPVEGLAGLAALWAFIGYGFDGVKPLMAEELKHNPAGIEAAAKAFITLQFPQTHLEHWMGVPVFMLRRDGKSEWIDEIPTKYNFPISKETFERVIERGTEILVAVMAAYPGG